MSVFFSERAASLQSPKAQFVRVFESAGCRTQVELAAILDIRQASISDAKGRGSIPPEWLVKLLRLRGVNPDWILSGTGPRFLMPLADLAEEGAFSGIPSPDGPADGALARSILRCFSSGELVGELLRRNRKAPEEKRERLGGNENAR